MEQYLDILMQSPLFARMEQQQVLSALGCLKPVVRSYGKGQWIVEEGQCLSCLGLVLAGSVTVNHEDYWGNREIRARLIPGQMFGETYACIPKTAAQVGVLAEEPVKAAFIEVNRLLHPCDQACGFHGQMIQNLVLVLAQKNLLLSEKLTHMAQRSTRHKLLSYLSAEAERAENACFTLSLNRQQLADYLSVDRSAMCRELSLMAQEGLLRYEKNRFELLRP